MTKVSMIVWNEFLNDARVMKEAQTLQRAGYQVRVFALHTPGVTQQQAVLDDGIEVVRVARSPLWKLRKKNLQPAVKAGGESQQSAPVKPSLKLLVLRAVSRGWTHLALLFKMLEYRATVVHSHDVNTLPTAWLAAKLSRARLVYDAHEISTSREGYKSLRKVVGFVEKQLMPSANGTITTTDARAKYFARAYGVERPLVLQNRPRLIESPPSNRIREELGLVEPWPIVLYQGGLQQGRGLEKLVRTAQHVPDCYFVLIGGGRLTQPLTQLAQELNLQHKVHFIPTVALAELPSYTASADVGVQPIENTCLNHYTTDSNKLFEYVIAGLPVIATDFPEIRRIVRSNDIGLLVPANNEQALSRTIIQLLEDPALRARFASNARKTAQNLNWESQEKCLVDLYERVLLTHAHTR
ncbi:glycosyltransferase family 4 protein [Pseudomonas sp. P1B16]|jgi:Glycosyltransferase|uniref:glycosyltransferase family 4 protein n=1 Tax=Pseudomonas TaxID=286 RepID=UPI000BA3D7B9|nr:MULTISPECIES: glycosyltransferase family 4 protein [unclassified Pseudomonas]MBC3482390.1 glycosyltransferase family 4 protein [Pseudomonas sp. SWRI77]MBC3500316.1 glycosyltransferase family 4 protein [Pseudomonas sp. SWRI59]MBC3505645.1 glycosyltransferase family 4 protein [Pseudomonas sp. SWRI68]MDD2062648.1 glycosyltransferase family 4 protein [Pseudomonas sp. 25571]UDU82624.1 glycosyltransferase family 4 protein [Pseudomonas sp. HN2-3]